MSSSVPYGGSRDRDVGVTTGSPGAPTTHVPADHVDGDTAHASKECDTADSFRNKDLLYGIDDVPPWYTCALLGFQQFLTALNGIVAFPLVVTTLLCMADDDPARGYVVNASFFVCGITTLIQCTIGVRLPIIQGVSWSFLPPIAAVMSLPEWKCPDKDIMAAAVTSEERYQIWQPRMAEVLGAITVASLVQVVLGATGAVGYMLRVISPITIVVTIATLGFGFFDSFQNMMAGHWGISLMTLSLVVIFSQYMRNLLVPVPWCLPGGRRGLVRVPLFKMLPVLLSIIIGTTVCAILTYYDVLEKDSPARTDTKLNGIRNAVWFRVPYPGQWGAPTVSIGAVLGMIAGVLASVVESIGDYYACSKMSDATPPPAHAMNRGILVEGFGGILCGLLGTVSASTSYSGNIGIIGITRVASRRVIVWAGAIMVLIGLVGKFGAVMVTIPLPVFGGTFVPLFGMIAGMGLASLQLIDLNSTRNMMIVGISILLALIIPSYVTKNPEVFATGITTLDQIIYVILSTVMFLAGVIACFLDNTIPGTDEERGMVQWRAQAAGHLNKDTEDTTYDLPFVMGLVKRCRWARFLPLSPTFEGYPPSRCGCRRRNNKEQYAFDNGVALTNVAAQP